jgi:hypothetical protein
MLKEKKTSSIHTCATAVSQWRWNLELLRKCPRGDGRHRGFDCQHPSRHWRSRDSPHTSISKPNSHQEEDSRPLLASHNAAPLLLTRYKSAPRSRCTPELCYNHLSHHSNLTPSPYCYRQPVSKNPPHIHLHPQHGRQHQERDRCLRRAPSRRQQVLGSPD